MHHALGALPIATLTQIERAGWLILYGLILLLICLWYWGQFRQLCKTKPFNYRITDIWAATVALMPTIVAFASLEKFKWLLAPEEMLGVALALGMSQLAGLLIGRIHIELPPRRGARSAWQSAISIVTGALLGIVILAAVVCFFMLPLFGMLLLGALYLLLSGSRSMEMEACGQRRSAWTAPRKVAAAPHLSAAVAVGRTRPVSEGFAMRKSGSLLEWDRTPGFLCDWHIAGFFDPGLAHNPDPNIFDKKLSRRWNDEFLGAWGGANALRDVPRKTGSAEIEWELLPLNWFPELSLLRGREEYPIWDQRLGQRHPDSWDRLYFALAVIDANEALDAELLFSGWDGCRLWINGALAFDEHSYHHVVWDMERVPFRLNKGANSFLFQLDRDGVIARIAIPAAPEKVRQLKSVAGGDEPVARNISTFAQMQRYAMSLQVQMPFDGKTPLSAWQDRFGAHFRRCLGPAPVRPAHLSAPKLISETRAQGYTRRLYHLACEGDGLIPAYILVPDKPNGRTLELIHGHQSPAEVAGAQAHHGGRGYVGSYTGNYGEQLAQRGFIVGLIHERVFGERRDYWGSSDPCNVAGFRAQSMGLTLARLHMADLELLYDLLCAIPGVEPRRLGLSGISGGGSLTYLAAAFDQRYKAAAVFCGMCRYIQYATGLNGCGMQTVPGLFPGGDVGEVLSLIAPRPLFLGQGRLDYTFNLLEFRSITQDAMRAYRAAGVEDRLEAQMYERAHEYDVDLAEKFFLKWL